MNFKRIFITLPAIFSFVLLLMLNGCKKEIEVKTLFVDAFVRSIDQVNGKDTTTVYAIYNGIYSYSKIDTIKLTASDGKQYPLINFENRGYSYFSDLNDNQYVKTVPALVTFTYNVFFEDGESKTVTDATIAKSLIPARGLKLVETATDIVVGWNPVLNMEAYKIRVFSNTNLIFESDFLVPKDLTKSLSVPFSLTSLSMYLETELMFEVSAFIFQQQPDTYHAVSVATKSVKLGI